MDNSLKNHEPEDFGVKSNNNSNTYNNHNSQKKGPKDQYAHHRMMIKDFRRRFYVSLIITVPILVFSPTIQGWLRYNITFPGLNYFVLILATFIFFYGGWSFLKGIVDELRKKTPGMMTLIAVVPVEKEEGDNVIGGSVDGDGSFKIKVKNTGEESYLSKVINLVRGAQASKSKTQRLADKAAFWLTVIALTVGFTTLFTWLAIGRSFTFLIERMATIMVITCPHALSFAIPLVVAISTSLSVKNGLLIRNRTSIEASRKISTILFDKTGTLTEGAFGVNTIQSFEDQYDKERIIQLSASLEQNSEHPIAKGIVEKAKDMDVILQQPSDFKAVKGKGVEGTLNGEFVSVISPNCLKELDISLPKNLERGLIDTVVFVLLNEKKLIGAILMSLSTVIVAINARLLKVK